MVGPLALHPYLASGLASLPHVGVHQRATFRWWCNIQERIIGLMLCCNNWLRVLMPPLSAFSGCKVMDYEGLFGIAIAAIYHQGVLCITGITGDHCQE